MTPEMIQAVTGIIEEHGYRELAAAKLFASGLRFVPRLNWLKFMSWHIVEEMDHYDGVVGIYRRFTGESLEAPTNALFLKRPLEVLSSYLEVAIAQFLYDRAALWQLREHEECAFLPYRTVVLKMVKEERGHQMLNERMLVEVCRNVLTSDKQEHFDLWWKRGMQLLGPPESESAAYAISAGLKKRSNGDAMQAFVDDIKPAIRACGLTFPDPAKLGLEVPAALNLSLPDDVR